MLSPKTLSTKAFPKRDKERDLIKGLLQLVQFWLLIILFGVDYSKDNAQDLHLANPCKVIRLVVTKFPRPEPHGLSFGPIKFGRMSLLKKFN